MSTLPHVYYNIEECMICGKKIHWWQTKGSIFGEIVKREVVNGVEKVYWQNYHYSCAIKKVEEKEGQN